MESGEMTKQAMLSVVGGPAETLTGAGARLRLLLAAKLVMTTGELPVTLRELSSTNAVVTGDGLPSVGTDALLRRGRVVAPGKGNWAERTGTCPGIGREPART